MKTIGIDTDNYLVYEGSCTWGHAIWPVPAILPAAIMSESSHKLIPENNTDIQRMPFIFIDEGYDPVSRVRKGRIYQRYDRQPNEWWVQMHPALPAEEKDVGVNGVIKKSLASFQQFNFYPVVKKMEIENPLIVLGSKAQFTIWSVIDVETSISGETILFLKARKTFGALPKINYSKMREAGQIHVKDKISRLSDDIHKAGPDSIVDRSREAASAIINTWLIENGYIKTPKDLGQLASILRGDTNKHIAANCADTLAKLHSRTKHSEQQRRSVRRIHETDAEFSVQAVVIILNEFGYVAEG